MFKKIFHSKNFDSRLIIILLVGLFVRLAITPFGTLELDHNTFVAWSKIAVSGGLGNFYNSWSDYLPGYVYVLWVLGHIHNAFPISTIFLYKLPAILADVATAGLIYAIVAKIKKPSLALFAAGLYIFNPSVFANSSLWGQVDSLTSFFSLAAVYFASINPIISAVCLSIGTAVKPQAALAALVVLYIAWQQKWKFSQLLVYGLVGLVVFVGLFVPFADGREIAGFIGERLGTTLNQYKYTSVNAFNMWGLSGMWQPDSWQNMFGWIMTLGVSIFAAIRLRKKQNGEYLLLSIVLLAGFLFMTRLHERHMLPVLAPLVVAVSMYPSLIFSYVLLSFVYVTNLYYAYVWITEEFRTIFDPTQISLLIFVNILAFVHLLYVSVSNKELFNISVFQKLKKVKPEKEIKIPEHVTSSQAKYLLMGILVFSFITRILFLHNPPQEYFDEVYHGFTARVLLHNDPKAWEWWNPHPEGYAYEWTHPPLAKEGMWLGMKLFGENSIGWRIPQALLGVGAVYLIYQIAYQLFKHREIALVSSAVFALDGLPLVMSRIAMNDSYLLFFVLLSWWLFLKDKLFFSSFALGLAAASKWSVMWFFPILLATHFALRKKVRLGYLWLLVIPPLLYLVSYIPFFTSGHTFEQFFNVQTFLQCFGKDECSLPYGLQQQMWWYHTNLEATHGYSSPWWSWPLLLRPVWAYVNTSIPNMISNIYIMGNPIVAWTGVIVFFTVGYYSIIERNKKLGLLIFAFLAFFASWAISPRIMFYYHFLPSFAFLSIMIGYIFVRFRKFLLPFLLVSLLVFVYFYPHWTGIPVPLWWDNTYYWLQSWK